VSGVTTGLSALSASVGLAIFPDDGEHPLEVIEAADHEAIEAKRARRERAARRAA
jgi:GGDEF domain-containing protein